MKRQKLFRFAVPVALAATGVFAADTGHFRAVSPDRRNEVRLETNAGGMRYSVWCDGKALVEPTSFSLATREHGLLDGRGAQPKGASHKVQGRLATPIYKKAAVDLAANETCVDFGDWSIRLHARNDGVAWRFETRFDGELTIPAENTDVVFPKGTELCCAVVGHFQTSHEKPATIGPVASVPPGHPQIVITPFTAVVPGAGVFSVTESNLLDYPGLNFYRRNGENDRLRSWQAGVPSKVDVGRRMTNVQKRHPYLAKTKGTRVFPWRVFVIGDSPSGLVSSDAVYALAEPSRIADVSWVKPGQVAWDWWNGFAITDIPGLATGCNYATYKEYVNFAAANGIAYIIMDEGWAEKLDLEKPRDDVNVPGVIAYAREKGVDVILWAAWAQLMDRGKRLRVFDRYASMGAKGFKIDFMNRDDQLLERFLEETAADAAERKLVVMYHGIHKPTGLCRTYPNVLNYEGVYGLEQGHSIGGRKVVVSNDVNLVYTRMIAGAMDYTPGAMRNRAFDAPAFHKGKEARACYGTRCHQLALFPIFEAPVQMLCDSPTQYRTAPECTAFLTSVPTVWDETVGVTGEIGAYAAVARRKGRDWWLGAITDWKARELVLPTGFLGSGDWTVEAFEDAPDSNVRAEQYVHRTFRIKAGEPIRVKLAPGGGFAAKIQRRHAVR
ncbi:MAG: glycoside hydrolase family 97 catalytic domain-containing protein [Kiritimatiellae bacterium]|nr:glycoside hydrolase family 97 catalytic domain-containing protein [Kiritimatiellia bacterium]